MTTLSINRTPRIMFIIVIGLLLLSEGTMPALDASENGPFVSVTVNGSCGQILTEGEVNITVTVHEPSQVKVIVVSPSGSERTIELEVEESVDVTLNLTGPPGLWSVLAIANSTLTSTQYESNDCSFVLYPSASLRTGPYTPPKPGSEGSFVSVTVNGSCGQILTEGEVNITVTVHEPSQVKVIVVSPANESENGFSEIVELEPMLVENFKNITFNLMGPSGLWSVLAIANSTLTLTTYASNICNIQVIPRKGFKQGKIAGLNVTDAGNGWLLKVIVENNGTLEETYGLKLVGLTNVTSCNTTSIRDIRLAPNDTKVLWITCEYPRVKAKGHIVLYRASNESFIYDSFSVNLSPKIVPIINETAIQVKIPGEIFLSPGQKGDVFYLTIINRASTEIDIHPSIKVGSKDLVCETNESLVIPPKETRMLAIKCKTLKEGRYKLELLLDYYREDLGKTENVSKPIHLTVSSRRGMGAIRIKSIEPSDLVVNETYRISIEFENRASYEMRNVTVNLALRNNLAKLRSSKLYIQSLKPNESKKINFEIETLSAGNETLEVLVKYRTENGSIIEDRLEAPLVIRSSRRGMGAIRIKSIEPSDLVVNETYRISIEFENRASYEMRNVTVNLALRNNLAKLRSSKLYIQSLKPNESKKINFEIETLSAGNETLEVLVKYRTENGSIIEDRLEAPLVIRSSRRGMGAIPLVALAGLSAIVISLLLLYMLKIRRRAQ